MLVLGSSAIVMLLLCFIEYVGSFPSYFLKPSKFHNVLTFQLPNGELYSPTRMVSGNSLGQKYVLVTGVSEKHHRDPFSCVIAVLMWSHFIKDSDLSLSVSLHSYWNTYLNFSLFSVLEPRLTVPICGTDTDFQFEVASIRPE